MSLACRLLVFASALTIALSAIAQQKPLRVCSDPNNLPFSNEQQQGFENQLARMVGTDLQLPIQFAWWPPRARFMEKWLKADRCDLVMGTTAGSELLITTNPYYRSSYVFVSRRDRHMDVASITDASLKNYRIGAQIIGDDGETVPPAQEMAQHGLVRNLVGYSLYGDPLAQNPSSNIITAVEQGKVDLAVAWGPLAGYFARSSAVALRITPICPPTSAAAAGVPFAFAISMGVRPDETALRERLNHFITRHRKQIRALLLSYGVPQLDGSSCASSGNSQLTTAKAGR